LIFKFVESRKFIKKLKFTTTFCTLIIWIKAYGRLINIPDCSISFIKQIGDGIWNGFIKKIYNKGKKLVYYTQDKFEQMIKKETNKYIKNKNKKRQN